MSLRAALRSLLAVIAFCTAVVLAGQGAGQVFQGADIEEMLKSGKIASLKTLPEGVTLPKKATLEFKGEQRFGVWKTIDEGPVPVKQLDGGVELQFQDSWRTEVAAYELDKLIGLGMVPATVPRTFNGKQGSMQFFVDSMMDEGQRAKKKIQAADPILWKYQLANMYLWDNLIYNIDRNVGNMLITSDWHIRLIDHSRTFRPFEQLQSPKLLTAFSRTLLESIRKLDQPTLQAHLGNYISKVQITALLKRRDAILSLADKLAAQKGAGSVLFP